MIFISCITPAVVIVLVVFIFLSIISPVVIEVISILIAVTPMGRLSAAACYPPALFGIHRRKTASA